MKNILSVVGVFVCVAVAALAFADDKGAKSGGGLRPGDTVPNFSGVDHNGNTVDLESLKGNIVVLEWFNNECPFVVKHYKNGDMNSLADRYKDKGVKWIAVNSTSGKTEQDMKAIASEWNINRPILLDKSGDIGKTFGARNTPAMYIIDKEGKLAYRGAIDDKPDPKPESISSSKNYVSQALDELLAGKPVSQPETKAYGCSVKYGK